MMIEALTPTKRAENLKIAESTIQNLRDLVSSSKKNENGGEGKGKGVGTNTNINTNINSTPDPWDDSEGYKRRLRTFLNPDTYFAKPLLLSPLVCARFGWVNTGKDLITCAAGVCSGSGSDGSGSGSSGKCKGAISVQFHPDLSPESEQKLTMTYRRMLASSHCDTCPFAMDSKRWLMLLNEIETETENENDHDDDIHTDTEKDTSTETKFQFVVPPYLISMSQEFQILEDSSRSGFVTKGHVIQEAIRLGKAMAGRNILWKDGGTRTRTRTDEICEKVTNQILKTIYRADSDTSRDIIDILDLLKDAISKKQVEMEHDDDDANLMTKESALLALFGWRLLHHSHADTENGNIQVACNFCHNQCHLALSSIQIQEDQHVSKRPRLTTTATTTPITSPTTTTTTAQFDLLHSHRHFCPLVSGFVPGVENETHTSGRSRPCWEIILEALCRGHEVQCGGDGSGRQQHQEQNRDENGEEAYRSIRRMINASFLKK